MDGQRHDTLGKILAAALAVLLLLVVDAVVRGDPEGRQHAWTLVLTVIAATLGWIFRDAQGDAR